MNRIEDSCPFDAAARASQCESCCEDTGALTPCVRAWLRSTQTIRPLPVIWTGIAQANRPVRAA